MSVTYEELSKERKELQKKGWLPEWYTTGAWQMFKAKYLVEGEEGAKGRWQTIAKSLAPFAPGDTAEWEKKFFDLMWNGWFSHASPSLSNTGTDRGMNVSCSGGVVTDSVNGFYTALREQALLSKHGFGCSGDFSSIRPRGSKISTGGKASGVVPVMDDFALMTSKISQGGTRRGSTASYVPIDHGDFWELSDKLLNEPDGLNVGWIVTDKFIQKLKDADPEASERYSRTLFIKLVTGRGYYFKIDEANRKRPQMYKDLGLDVKASNLCTEIMLHSSEKYTYSCILSSLNLAKWDEYKDTNAIFDAMVMMDCMVSYFLKKSEGVVGLEKVRDFTVRGRAVGLGVLGFGTLLQKKRIPFESLDAQFLNSEIFSKIQKETERASRWLAEELGEPEWCKGYGVRNTHRTALAPTKSTSILMGSVSETTLPDPGMVYEQTTPAGDIKRVNPELYSIMVERGVYNKKTIDDIIDKLGSVQHVEWLTPDEKWVFKTAFEVDQDVILRYASQRQKYLCQGQSINFYFAEDEQKISDTHTKALLDPNILSLYYVYSRSGVVVDNTCIACEA